MTQNPPQSSAERPSAVDDSDHRQTDEVGTSATGQPAAHDAGPGPADGADPASAEADDPGGAPSYNEALAELQGKPRL